MSWLSAAVAGSAVLGAYGANKAANTQAGALNEAAKTQQRMFDTINSQELPFMQAGYGATSKLNDMLGTSGNTAADNYGYLTKQFTPQDFQANLDPGYQWQKEQGQQALQNSQAANSGILSGPALKELMSYNQGMASTGYQNAFNRYTTQQSNIFSRLSNIAGLGQNAATQTGNAGVQLGTGVAQAQAQAGAASAAGTVGVTNSLSSAPLNYLLYSKILGGGGGGTPLGTIPSSSNLGAGTLYGGT